MCHLPSEMLRVLSEFRCTITSTSPEQPQDSPARQRRNQNIGSLSGHIFATLCCTLLCSTCGQNRSQGRSCVTIGSPYPIPARHSDGCSSDSPLCVDVV